MQAQPVFEALYQRRGKAQRIKAGPLVQLAWGVPSRPALEARIRNVIEELRQEGHAIMSEPGSGGGYWFADSPEEVTATADWLKDKAIHTLWICSKLRRLGMAQVSGQMLLPIDFASPGMPDVPHKELPLGSEPLILELPSDLVKRLRERAESQGIRVEELVAQAIKKWSRR